MPVTTKFPLPPIWLIVDGTNAVYRDLFGGGPARAADTFSRRLQEMIAWWKPACVITAWDCGPSFRHDLFPGYKADRSRPEGIEQAIAEAKAKCIDVGVGVMSVAGFEADDLLATLADAGRADGCRVVIYSSDKDLHQCIVNGEVCQLIGCKRVKKTGATNQTNHLEFTWRSAKDLQVEFGVTPEQWVDYKCLVGDPSDKIDGVKGIGPQAAGRLLSSCGSIDGFYHNMFKAAVTTGQRAALMNAKSRMPLLKQLCTLRRDVPLPEMWREAC